MPSEIASLISSMSAGVSHQGGWMRYPAITNTANSTTVADTRKLQRCDFGCGYSRDEQIKTVMLRIGNVGEEKVVLRTDSRSKHFAEIDPTSLIRSRNQIKGRQSGAECDCQCRPHHRTP